VAGDRPRSAPGMTPDEAGPHSGARGLLHHVELWVPDLRRAVDQWGWLLGELGYQDFQRWDAGRSWRLGPTYLVVEQSPAMTADPFDRLRPGLNHLAFHAGSPPTLDAMMSAAPQHDWAPLFDDRYPHAGGEQSYAGYLVNSDGFEIELVAG